MSYINLSDAPNTQARTIEFSVSDGTSTTTATRQILITAVNDVPVVDGNGSASGTQASVVFITGSAPIALVPGALASDPDSPTLNGGVLRVQYLNNGYATNQLSIGNIGTGAGQVGVSGTTVTYEGVAIGTVAGGQNGAELTVTFTGAATLAAAQAVARDILFASTATAPNPNNSALGITLSDGAGGTSATSGVFVSFRGVTIGSNGGGDTAAISVAELQTAVTNVTASSAVPVTYAVVTDASSPDAARFTINPTTGALRFARLPNFEEPADADRNNSYIVKVRASDGSTTDDQIITVAVTDAPERTSFKTPVDWSPAIPGGANPWFVGDFNGDRIDDGFRVESAYAAYISDGTTFIGSRNMTSASPGSDGRWQFGDFN